MQNNEHKIDQVFREKLSGYGSPPPPAVWDRISDSMGYSRRKNNMLWLWRASAAASVLLAFLAGWYLSNQTNNDQQLFSELEQIRANQSKQLIIHSPVEQNISIQLQPTPIQPFIATAYPDQERLFAQATTAQRETVVIENLNPRENGLLTSKASQMKLSNPNIVLLNEADQEIIEANLLALANQSETRGSKNSWAVGVQGSPVFSFDQPATGNNYHATPESGWAQRDVATSYQPSLVGGISVSYNTGSKISITSGISYNELAQGSANVGVSFAGQNWLNERMGASFDYASTPIESNLVPESNNVMLNTQSGLANVTLPKGVQLNEVSKYNSLATNTIENYDLKQAAGYIEIPFLMRYKLLDKQFGIHLLGGINTNVLVSNNVQLVNRDEIIASGVTEGLRDIAFSSSVGMGMSYEISQRFAINVEPTLKVFLNSLNSQANFNTRPYSLGIFSGVTYQF